MKKILLSAVAVCMITSAGFAQNSSKNVHPKKPVTENTTPAVHNVKMDATSKKPAENKTDKKTEFKKADKKN